LARGADFYEAAKDVFKAKTIVSVNGVILCQYANTGIYANTK